MLLGVRDGFAPFAVIPSVAIEPSWQPLKNEIVQPNNARVCTQVIRSAGRRLLTSSYQKNPLTAGAGGLTLHS